MVVLISFLVFIVEHMLMTVLSIGSLSIVAILWLPVTEILRDVLERYPEYQ